MALPTIYLGITHHVPWHPMALSTMHLDITHHAPWHYPSCTMALPTMHLDVTHHAPWYYPSLTTALPTMHLDITHHAPCHYPPCTVACVPARGRPVSCPEDRKKHGQGGPKSCWQTPHRSLVLTALPGVAQGNHSHKSFLSPGRQCGFLGD